MRAEGKSRPATLALRVCLDIPVYMTLGHFFFAYFMLEASLRLNGFIDLEERGTNGIYLYLARFGSE